LKVSAQDWDGLETVPDLPGRGRGVMATRNFVRGEVVCDYHGELLGHQEGKARYEASPENASGFMFAFRHRGKKLWLDATAEQPGVGRLINHSRCHANVSKSCD
jgi:[histone H4]-lysine20 N-methyltransferase SETD8